jgi:hypothetical protein
MADLPQGCTVAFGMTLRIAMRVIALIVCLAFATPALAAEPWEGIWAAEKDWCRYADEIGSHFPAPIKITSSRVLGIENACDITRVKRINQFRAWIIDMACEGEGLQYDDREIFLITRDDLLLRYTMDSFAIEMHRCPQG